MFSPTAAEWASLVSVALSSFSFSSLLGRGDAVLTVFPIFSTTRGVNPGFAGSVMGGLATGEVEGEGGGGGAGLCAPRGLLRSSKEASLLLAEEEEEEEEEEECEVT